MMEEKCGTCLSRSVTVLVNWGYSLMPYGVVLMALFCWVVLGWRDVPFWRVWYPIFLLSVVGRYGVYLVQFIYGWLAKLSKATVTLDVLATAVTLLWFVTEDASVSPFWRYYIISVWIGGGCWLFACTSALAGILERGGVPVTMKFPARVSRSMCGA